MAQQWWCCHIDGSTWVCCHTCVLISPSSINKKRQLVNHRQWEEGCGVGKLIHRKQKGGETLTAFVCSEQTLKMKHFSNWKEKFQLIWVTSPWTQFRQPTRAAFSSASWNGLWLRNGLSLSTPSQVQGMIPRPVLQSKLIIPGCTSPNMISGVRGCVRVVISFIINPKFPNLGMSILTWNGWCWQQRTKRNQM